VKIPLFTKAFDERHHAVFAAYPEKARLGNAIIDPPGRTAEACHRRRPGFIPPCADGERHEPKTAPKAAKPATTG